MDGIWDELDLAPTTDKAAIRRAYAARLKSIDPDSDPAAFMRLRHAYESALTADVEDLSSYFEDEDVETSELAEAMARDDEAKPNEEPRADRIVQRDVSPAEDAVPADDILPHGALAAFESEFRYHLNTYDNRAARTALDTALARGVVPLGQEASYVQWLLIGALQNSALSADDLDAYTHDFAPTIWAQFAPTELLQDLKARAAALRWWAGVERRAKKGAGWGVLRRPFSRTTRVACAIRTGRPRWLAPGDVEAFAAELAILRSHARWLPADPERVGQELRRVRLVYAWLLVAMIALLFSPALFLRLPIPNDVAATLSLSAFAAGGLGICLMIDFGKMKGSFLGVLLAFLRWVLVIACCGIVSLIVLALTATH